MKIFTFRQRIFTPQWCTLSYILFYVPQLLCSHDRCEFLCTPPPPPPKKKKKKKKKDFLSIQPPLCPQEKIYAYHDILNGCNILKIDL